MHVIWSHETRGLRGRSFPLNFILLLIIPHPSFYPSLHPFCFKRWTMDARLRRVNKEIAGTYTLELEATVTWIDDMRGLVL